MKEIDDTPVPENESEEVMDRIEARIADLERFKHNSLLKFHLLKKQVANLEAQRPPQATNPDPEWY